MAVDTFIPEVWNAQLFTTLSKRIVLGGPRAVNRNYEGDIANFGDTVHIGTLSDPTISSYTKNSTTITPETLATTDQSLVIDQAKYFAFEVDDVDMRQARSGGELLTRAAERSAVLLAETADTYLGTIMTAGAGTTLTAGTASTADEAYNILRSIKVAHDNANIPTDGRWVAVSPEFYSLLLADARFTDASAFGSNDPIMNGQVGRALGYSVLVSTNLPEGTAATAPAVSNYVIAGHSEGTTYAEQINKTEAYRPEDSFSDAIKGLHLYGAKVVRSEFLVVQDVDVTV